jgi:hypothetical protein
MVVVRLSKYQTPRVLVEEWVAHALGPTIYSTMHACMERAAS